jgi:hypothetical protein
MCLSCVAEPDWLAVTMVLAWVVVLACKLGGWIDDD